jgi:hypothetical protein
MGFNYCILNDVKTWLAGVDVSEMPPTLDLMIEQTWIPWAKGEVDAFCGDNFDLTTINEFYDGSGGKDMILNHRPISFVRNVVLRVIPALEWFHFLRWFHLNTTDQFGHEVTQRGGVEPIGGAIAPYVFAVGSPTPVDMQGPVPTGNFNNTTEQYEKADLFADCRRGILTIPPRILYLENQAVPFWNYTFLRSTNNIEIEYDYGYKNIDSLPVEIRQASAQLVAAAVLANKGQFASAGASSITLGGTSKSFGEMPYANYIRNYITAAKATLNRYKRISC